MFRFQVDTQIEHHSRNFGIDDVGIHRTLPGFGWWSESLATAVPESVERVLSKPAPSAIFSRTASPSGTVKLLRELRKQYRAARPRTRG